MLINIRKAKKSDLDTLSEIYVKAYTKVDIDEIWTKEAAKKLLAYWLTKQSDLFFVAEYNGKIAGGFVAGIKPWWDGNHLVDGEIFVDPSFQKKGIGTELSKTLFKKALDKYNVTRYDCVTYNNHKFPLAWYKSLGLIPSDNLILISGDLKSIITELERRNPNQG